MLRKAIANNKPPLFHKPVDAAAKSAVEPASWNKYFESTKLVSIQNTNNAFQVYFGRESPISGPTFVMLHGCGLSAMSWALVANILKAEFNVIAFDFRGHGTSVTDNDHDLAADTLVNDTVQLLDALYGGEATPPAIILVGHSMGGAIATQVAASGKVKGLVGLAVVDVVEGSALAALSSMRSIIAKRPSSFSSVFKAIEWAISSETVRNLESAQVSIPAQLLEADDGRWVWRTDLARTEEYWEGWFTNLSKVFLGARVAKLLLLAGTDRLDRDMTVGQMQGKFQLTVLPAVGHLVQEDAPRPTAEALTHFCNRYQFGKPFVLPKPPPPKPQEI